MGRTVADVALLDDVITGQPAPQRVPLKGVRLGIPRAPFWEELDSEIAEIAESTLARFKAAGAVLVDLNLGSLREFNNDLRPIVRYEFRLDLAEYLADGGNRITVDDVLRQIASKDVTEMVAATNTIGKSVYDAAVNIRRPQLQKIYADSFAQHALAAIVFPTTPLPARPIKEVGDTGRDTVELNGRQVPTFATYGRNTGLGSLAGLPGLSVPIGMTRAGLPVGLEFDGPVNSDHALLGLGMSVENEIGVLPAPKV